MASCYTTVWTTSWFFKYFCEFRRHGYHRHYVYLSRNRKLYFDNGLPLDTDVNQYTLVFLVKDFYEVSGFGSLLRKFVCKRSSDISPCTDLVCIISTILPRHSIVVKVFNSSLTNRVILYSDIERVVYISLSFFMSILINTLHCIMYPLRTIYWIQAERAFHTHVSLFFDTVLQPN